LKKKSEQEIMKAVFKSLSAINNKSGGESFLVSDLKAHVKDSNKGKRIT
jgi:hypothetical protein